MDLLNERIKSRRLELGLTLAELAEKIGVRDATIQRYESGEIKNIKRSTVVKLAEALKTTPAYLMGWESPNSNTSSSDDDLLDLLRNNKEHATIIGFGDGRHIKTDMTYEDFEELEAMWRALKEKRKQDK